MRMDDICVCAVTILCVLYGINKIREYFRFRK